jgi:hypothetical protein
MKLKARSSKRRRRFKRQVPKTGGAFCWNLEVEVRSVSGALSFEFGTFPSC